MVAFLGGFLTDLTKSYAFGRLPKTLLLAGKRNGRRLKMQPFADHTAQKRNLSVAIEIAAHFLRNERHYLVDVLGKTLKKACLQSFSRVFGGCFGERP